MAFGNQKFSHAKQKYPPPRREILYDRSLNFRVPAENEISVRQKLKYAKLLAAPDGYIEIFVLPFEILRTPAWGGGRG